MGVQQTSGQIANVIKYSQDLIENLPDKALLELFGGNENDIDGLYNDILNETNRVINIQQDSIRSENLQYLENVEKAIHERLKVINYNYFKTTCLPEFNQGWRNIEWGNMIQLYQYLNLLASRSSGKSFEISLAFPLWKAYGYQRPNSLQRQSSQNKLRKEGVIVTNEYKLGKKLMSKIINEISVNDIIGEKLRPNGRGTGSLGVEKIVTANGAEIELRSLDSSIRGLHPGWIGVDDFLDKSAIYSAEARAKFGEVFFAEIMPALEPGGQIVAVGTPFSDAPDDLYNRLKEDARFKQFIYPAIFPDGRLLAPDRYTFDKLMQERRTLGSLVFAREYLVVPVSDGSSIFPWEILGKSTMGMENISYVDNIESFPFKLKRVVTGCDFAISGNVSADFCAFTTMGIDSMDNIYKLNIWHKKGASHNEMINQIVSINQRFKPNKIVVETNGFQMVMAQMAKQRGLRNIEPFHTGDVKKDLYKGIPALGAAYERGQVRNPYKEGDTREMTNKVFNEHNSITFTDKGKLEAAAGHDDLTMSEWLAFMELQFNKSQFKVHMV